MWEKSPRMSRAFLHCYKDPFCKQHIYTNLILHNMIETKNISDSPVIICTKFELSSVVVVVVSG